MIQSILDHNFTELKQKLIFIGLCWIFVVISIFIDLLCGCYKANQRGEFRTSEGFKRTVSKFILYFSALALAFLADCVFDYTIISFNRFIPAIPYLTILLTIFVIVFVEGRSIFEKASDKEKKQLSKDAIRALEVITKIKDSDVLDKLIEIAKSKQEE
ncbi:hypothetical protein FACS189434_07910 [Bacteroidia bacterium]|nr:hypothetical protein FACS189434_07910 [Bacteroidia bacterium]